MSKRQKKNILVTGAGGSIAINLTRSLLMASVDVDLFGCDSSPYFIHLAETKEKALIPSAKDPKLYLHAIGALVKKWQIDLIVPSNMIEILVLAKNREKIGARLFLPSTEALEKGADKWESYQVFNEADLPVPKTILLNQPEDADRAFAEFGKKVWLRGRGIPGRGVGVASLPAESATQAKAWTSFHKAWGQMTAAEYLPGENLTWMGLFKNGELIASQGRKRIAYVISHVSPSGVTGAPSVSKTIHHEEINLLGEKTTLLMDPKFSGVAFVDFKCDAKESPKITEINVGRFGTTHHFYSVAGANFPEWYVKLAFDEKVELKSPYNVLPEDLVWIRTLDSNPVLIKEQDLHRYSLKL